MVLSVVFSSNKAQRKSEGTHVEQRQTCHDFHMYKRCILAVDQVLHASHTVAGDGEGCNVSSMMRNKDPDQCNIEDHALH